MNPEKICVFENNSIKVFNKFVLKNASVMKGHGCAFLHLKKFFYHDNVGT